LGCLLHGKLLGYTFGSSLARKPRLNQEEMKTLQEAKNKMISKGAVRFEGGVQNCGVIECYGLDGMRVGHIYSSYDSNFSKIYRLGYSDI
jgi:hypothetical protein